MKKTLYIFLIILTSCNYTSKKDLNTTENNNSSNICIRCGLDTIISDSIQILNCREYDSITNETFSRGKSLYDQRTDRYYRYGWHSYFNNNKLLRKIEYRVEGDSTLDEVVNQFIEFNEKGDTIKELSSYLEIEPHNLDTFKLGTTIPLKFKINHLNNTKEVKGAYKLFIYAQEGKTKKDKIYSKEPFIEFDFQPNKIGLNYIEGHVLFFTSLPSAKDSVSVIAISFDRKYNVLE